jgi:hypothetical protein
MSIYKALKEAGCEMDSHESDLYVKDTAVAREVLSKHDIRFNEAEGGRSWGRFVSQIDGAFWIDIPFAYEPWWDRRAR